MAKDSEGEYARILRRLIDDPDYCRRSPNAKLVQLTMLIAPEFRVMGIAPLDVQGLVQRTGLPPRSAGAAVAELEEDAVIRRDGRWVWIRNHLRFQENSEAWTKSPQTMIGLSKRVNELPAGLSFFKEFIQVYGALGFRFTLQPRHERYLINPPDTPINKDKDNPEPETPDTPETPETPEYPEEPVAVATAVPASPALEAPPPPNTPDANPRKDTFHAVAERHVACFNAVFGRRLHSSPEVVEKTRSLIRAGYRPWQIVALPILVDAQGISADMRKRATPQIILRDGKHGRTVDGQTYGATHWLERALSRIDQTTLTARQVAAARAFDVLRQLREMGVHSIEEAS